MKKCYPKLHIACILIILILSAQFSSAQCLNGFEPTGKSFDTTVATGSGNYETILTFPKFHPDSGMVTCVKLIMTITGVARLDIENRVNAPTSYNANYTRRDTISGPGLTTPLTQSVNNNYGPFNLAANDGVNYSGPDFVTVGPDTVLNGASVVTTITDVNVIADHFYGLDSVDYRYAIKAGATLTGSGDYLFSPSTSGFVNYRLEYCYCPPTVLPMGLLDFQVNKKGDNTAALNWNAETDNNDFHYEIQVSRDGRNFKPAGVVQKKSGINPTYTFQYDRQKHETGQLYFRVQQRYHNGVAKFTAVQSVNFENTLLNKISLYPNPSSGNVGIKFVNVTSGKLSIRISNVQGQTVVSKDLVVAGTDYKQIATLQRGMYWMKITDVTTQETVVNQLLIK